MTNEKRIKTQDTIKATEQQITDNELKIVRTFNAPRELMYKAFIDPIYLARWWGTYYCVKNECELDVRVGGKVSITMFMPGDKEVTVTGEYYELIENEKIVFSTGIFDEKIGDFDTVNVNTVVFEEIDGKTKLSLTVKMVKANPERAEFAFKGMVKSWPESIARLEEFIKSEVAER